MVKRHCFPKKRRICERASFDRVFARRCTAGGALFTVHVAENTCGHARLGIAAGRRLGNAVTRNRAKRIIREAFRELQHTLPAIDMVCVIRNPNLPRAQVIDSLPQLVRRALVKLRRCL